VAHKPYFRLIEPGLHLGYRKLADGPGTWIARRYGGAGNYSMENLRSADGAIVLADDFADADGEGVLSFTQAQNRVRGPRVAAGAYTIGAALDDYLRFLKSDGRSERAIKDARYRADSLIRPKLGAVKIGQLTSDRLRRWRDELVSVGPRLRTRPGEEQRYRDGDTRASRASANRTWTTLRAALNHAFSEGKTDSDSAWRKVKPFKGVDVARIRYLSVAEAKRLTNASGPEFRPLVQAALQTGCRYGELTSLEVRDFNTDAGTLAIRQSKTGKPRHVVLSGEGAKLFAAIVVGRNGRDLIFRRANGQPWGHAHQFRPIREACERAKLVPINFHGLRHSWASLAVMNGMPLMVVARNLGHVDTRMVEKHYGHLAPSYIAEAIRANAPRFGFKPDKKVVALKSR
jgi:integrase